mmetsp:Transcript_2343/g.3291  ORF Transcript_2343/g.3291 Transcript_2343/m.3291 type:complete len:91 (+) Transcript_2343:441-713(+)
MNKVFRISITFQSVLPRKAEDGIVPASPVSERSNVSKDGSFQVSSGNRPSNLVFPRLIDFKEFKDLNVSCGMVPWKFGSLDKFKRSSLGK